MSSQPHHVCWHHVIFSTVDRRPMLSPKAIAEAGMVLDDIASRERIELAACSVRTDHVHLLFNLPRSRSLDRVIKVVQRDSRRRLKRRKLLPDNFAWAAEYAAFSVSVGLRHRVRNYIVRQDDVHANFSFGEEWSRLIAQAGLPDHLYGTFEASLN